MADRLYRCSRRQLFPMIILCVGNGLWAGTVVVVALGSRFMIDAATQSNRSIFPESRKKCFIMEKQVFRKSDRYLVFSGDSFHFGIKLPVKMGGSSMFF